VLGSSWNMGSRRGAQRREQRHAKRALARLERGSKKSYANQKGGANQRGSDRHRAQPDGDEHMVVVRNGKAVRMKGADPEESAPRQRPSSKQSAVIEPTEPARFSEIQKKVRALEKKQRQLEVLKAQVRRGFELDAQQQAKLRRERHLEAAIRQARVELGEEGGAGEGEQDDDADDDGDDEEESPKMAAPSAPQTSAPQKAPSAEQPEGSEAALEIDQRTSQPTSRSKLAQRRQAKRDRHLASLDSKRAMLSAKERLKEEQQTARRAGSERARKGGSSAA